MSVARRRVSEIMRREVATLAPDEKLDLGDDLMKLGRVRHLPVLDGERLVGMVSERDVLGASLSRALDFEAGPRRSFLRSVEVAEVMTTDLVTIGPDATLAEAAQRLVERRIGALPVVDGGTLVGLVTATDLLAAAYAVDVESEPVGVANAAELQSWLEAQVEELKRARDELRVQVQLAKAEVRDRWAEAEKGLAFLEQRARRVARSAEGPLHQLESDARKLVGDLREGYRRIRDSL